MHDISYANLMLYNAVLPSYGAENKNGQKVIDASDPKNKDKVNKILFG